MLQSSNLHESQIKETYFTYSLSSINFYLLVQLDPRGPVKRSEHVYCVGMTTFWYFLMILAFLIIFTQLLARRLMKMPAVGQVGWSRTQILSFNCDWNAGTLQPLSHGKVWVRDFKLLSVLDSVDSCKEKYDILPFFAMQLTP